MKKYELTVLIHPDLEMNMAPATDKVEKLIEDSGGTIIKDANEGKKHMSYKIAKQDFAVYYYYEAELPPDAPRKISNVLNITDEVIRYLLVAADPRKQKLEARRKAAHADESDEDIDEKSEESEKNEESQDNINEEAEAGEPAEAKEKEE